MPCPGVSIQDAFALVSALPIHATPSLLFNLDCLGCHSVLACWQVGHIMRWPQPHSVMSTMNSAHILSPETSGISHRRAIFRRPEAQIGACHMSSLALAYFTMHLTVSLFLPVRAERNSNDCRAPLPASGMSALLLFCFYLKRHNHLHQSRFLDFSASSPAFVFPRVSWDLDPATSCALRCSFSTFSFHLSCPSGTIYVGSQPIILQRFGH